MTSMARLTVMTVPVIAAFLAAGCTAQSGTASSGPGSTAAASSSAPSTGQASAATAHPSATQTGPATLSVPKGREASVTAWGTGRGGSALQAVSDQVGVTLQATGLGKYATARRACVRLVTGVATARTAPPIPDVPMQHLYEKALTEIGRGAAGCRAAIAQHANGTAYFKVQHDVANLRQSTSVLSAGADDLYRATGELKALERQ
jgi:hypothetical protein